MALRTRETLNELAKELNNKYGTELSAKESFEHHLSAEWAKFTKFMDEPRTDDEANVAIMPVRAAVSICNDEYLMERLEEMEKMTHRDAILDYLRTQCVPGWRIKPAEIGAFALESGAAVYLDAYDVISTICSADLGGIIDACCIFADNVARFVISDSAAISKNSMHQTYLDLRKRKGWDMEKAQMSKTSLAKQMTEICKFISCGVAPEMRKSDVTYVMHGIIQAKDKADSAGGMVKRDERTIVRYIFRALYTRYNKLSYEFQDTTRASKGAMTVKNNKEMAEAPIEKEVVAEAEKATSETVEK